MKNKKLKITTSIISLAILITPISTLINNSNIASAKTNIHSRGLGALGLSQSFSDPSAFELAIQQAYWQGKGIDVYYHISKSIMSLNYVSYVVI